MPTVTEFAVKAVTVDEDARHVCLRVPGAEPVVLGPFENPAVAREKAEAVRAFVAAVRVAPDWPSGD